MLPLAAEFWNGSGATLISTGFSNIKTRADPASVIRKKSVAVLPAFSSRQQLSLATKGTAPVWGPGPKGTLEFRKEARNQRRYVSRHLNSTQRLQFSLFQSAQ